MTADIRCAGPLERGAGEILGLHKSRVAKLVAVGKLKSRGGRKASLGRAEVIALAKWRAEAPGRLQKARERRAAEREAGRTYRQPPDAEHDWLSVSQAAELLGVSRVAVGKRCRRGRLPYAEHGGMRWIRRDLLELVERARTAKVNHRVLTAPSNEGAQGVLGALTTRSSRRTSP